MALPNQPEETEKGERRGAPELCGQVSPWRGLRRATPSPAACLHSLLYISELQVEPRTTREDVC